MLPALLVACASIAAAVALVLVKGRRIGDSQVGARANPVNLWGRALSIPTGMSSPAPRRGRARTALAVVALPTGAASVVLVWGVRGGCAQGAVACYQGVVAGVVLAGAITTAAAIHLAGLARGRLRRET